MEGRPPQNRSRQPLRAQKGQKQPRAPVALTVPPAEEENPRVKCKNCGAFGHKASSTRCPMKRWDGALAPQPLGSQKMKENRQLCSLQDTGNEGCTARPPGLKEQSFSQEDQQRQALLQRFPRRALVRLQPPQRSETESCDYVKHSHQPMPVHTTQRRGVGDAGFNTRTSDRKPHETSTVSPIYRTERNTFSPLVLSKEQGVPVSDSHHRGGTGFVQDPGSNPQSSSHGLISQAQAKNPGIKSPSMGQAAAHTSGQDSKVSLQAPGKRAAQNPLQTGQNEQKKARLSPCQSSRKSALRADLVCAHPGLPPASAPVVRPALAPQAPRKTPAQGQSVHLKPSSKGPLLGTVHACLVSQHLLLPQRARQPLRMVLRKVKRGQWSSRLLTAPSGLPAEEPAPAAESPSSLEMSEGPCACIPSSVLYEDLQVSSSSEDSEDTQVCSSSEDSDGQ